MIFSQNYANAIINELKLGKRHFNQLKAELKLLPKTLSSHLNKMYEQQIIDRDPIQIGKSRNYWLTDVTIIEMELGYFEGVKSKRNKKIAKRKLESDEDDLAKIIVHLILRRATLGTERLGKPRPITELAQFAGRRHMVYSKDVYYEPVYFEGFSVEDIVKHSDFVDGSMFKRKLDEVQVEKIVKRLTETQPPIIKPYVVNGELLYRLCDDKLLKKFIVYCEIMLNYVIIRMEKTWNYRKPLPHTDEVQWYKSIYGRNKTNNFFLELKDKKIMAKKKELRRQIENWDKMIKSFTYSLFEDDEFKKIRESQYSYYRAFSKMLLEEVYPNFLRDLHRTHRI